MAMQARVVVYRDQKQELCVPIAESGAGIGRDAVNPVQLSSREVSKQHAFLQRTPAGWCIRDLGSRNGLLVNGRPVQEAILKDGDKLKVGPYTLVFEVEEAGHPYTPRLQIDLSSNAAQQTMPPPCKKPGGP
jgi:pSer/pThr/pTyr-binding forkhead associated (FHA) protein